MIGADNTRLGQLGHGKTFNTLSEGGYEIRTTRKHIIIAGGPNRSTVNGMYGFLQDHLGCRWFTPGCMKIPRRPTLVVGDIADRQQPDFTWRSTNPAMHWDVTWTARNRL